MPRSAIRFGFCLTNIVGIKFICIGICTYLLASFLWIQSSDINISIPTYDTLIGQLNATAVVTTQTRAPDATTKLKTIKTPETLTRTVIKSELVTPSPINLIHILRWTFLRWDTPFDYMMEGQKAFFKYNCSFTNCYVTSNRSLLGGDITKFDAIAFHSLDMHSKYNYELPKFRSPHQKYIVFNMESSDIYPICNPVYDGFFNWTATYKLDSDIPIPYIQIRNKEGRVVGPKRYMEWKKNMKEAYESVPINKTKAAAWFVSNCESRSGRDRYVKKLQMELKPFRLQVDIYGNCGPFKCPRNREKECYMKLEREYFFYLAMENSFSEDYVTEKLLNALLHDVVPVVYGAANYSWFLPPGSYLDANKLKPKDMAATMHRLINSPDLYRKYFSWKHHYSYRSPMGSDNVCAVCEALNNNTMVETHSSYKEWRKWWNPDFKNRC